MRSSKPGPIGPISPGGAAADLGKSQNNFAQYMVKLQAGRLRKKVYTTGQTAATTALLVKPSFISPGNATCKRLDTGSTGWVL